MKPQKLKAIIRQAARKCPQEEVEFVQKYLGTKRKFICVKAADRDKIIRQTVADLKEFEPNKTIEILDELFSTDTFEDFNFAGKMLTRLPGVRAAISMAQIEKWVSKSSGWAECDSICQSLFDEKEVLSRWREFEKAIKKFRTSKNIQLRRASLVLQVKSNRTSNKPKLKKLAFETIELLKEERDVLITKAISWLLRETSRENSMEVEEYIENNKETLPKIAYRETMKKITTGKK